nr:von Willebrand factor and C-type lectin domain containing protein [Haemonchus contortus]
MMLRLVLFALCLTAPITAHAPSSLTYINTTCECNLKTIWLDVFLLMDKSVMMGGNGISSATDYIVSAFGKLTVGQKEEYQTRLGVISFADSVNLIADLNQYTSKADLFELEIQPSNETGTNIDGAIRLAREKFASSTSRRAARKVIIIVGGSYTQTVYEDPTTVAGEFRSEGGIIITVEYLQGTKQSNPMFKKLASPNYSLINFENGKQLHAQELRQLLCRANCFCKRKWTPYADKWSAPQGGCYFPVKMSANQMLANRTCFRKNDGILAVVEDLKKDAFLTNLVTPNTNFWLGLQRKGDDWIWSDGYPVGRFTKWAKGHPISGKGDCVYMQKNANNKAAWFADDCENDHFSICQTKPCDSTKYCPFQLSNDEREI